MDRRQFITTLAVAAAVGTARASVSIAGESVAGKDRKGPAIPRRVLGKTGVKVSTLIIGGVGGMKQPPTEQLDPAELANAALDAGIDYFDTAPSYGAGQSETNYGRVLATRRKEVFLATKTGDRSYDGAMKEVETSLKRLRTDRLDLLQLHGVRAKEDFTKWDKPDGVMKALRKLKEEKVTRFIGVTGHESADAMRRAIELFDFDTILTTFNPTARRRPFEELVLPLARKKKMGILAMKVMGGGYGSLAIGNPIKNDPIWYHDTAPRQAKPGTLIRYVLGLPISAAVVGVSSLEHIPVNVAAVCDAQPLDAKERKRLEKHMS
jgi:aryl-alcohol dehydrogenase-like predicted oxidoreductase